MFDQTNRDFFELLRVDEKQAIDFLFQTYYSSLCNIVNRIVNDHDLSEDIVQEIFIRLWKKRFELKTNGSIKNYLQRSVINESISYLRKEDKKRHVSIDSNKKELIHTEYNKSENKELKRKIRKAINSLPPQCKAIYTLSRFTGYSNKEIAEIMEISVKTVENHMTIALRRIREELSK